MLKTLGAQIKEFKKDSIKTPLFMILEVLMEMLIPFLMASIIDDGVEKGDIRHICIIGGWMIVAALIGLYAGIMGGVYGANASAGFARNLRKAMYENIQQFSFSNIDRFSTAGLITRLTTDVTNVQNAYQMLLRMFVRAPISMVCAMIMSFISMQNWQVFIWWQLLFWEHACSLSSAGCRIFFRKYLKNMMI